MKIRHAIHVGIDTATRVLVEGVIGIVHTIGIGQAPEHGHNLNSLLDRVDKALYEAKANRGRDGAIEQVSPASSGVPLATQPAVDRS